MRYWIRDEDKTPQGFPLKLLFQLILQQLGSTVYQLWILRSEGYGLRVNEWGEILDTEERLLLNPALFLEISSGQEEWFYNFDAEIITDKLQVRFGLHDSTALYIEASKEFTEEVIKSFDLVKVDDNTGENK